MSHPLIKIESIHIIVLTIIIFVTPNVFAKMTYSADVVKSLQKTYKDNLSLLTLQKQAHWLIRMHRIGLENKTKKSLKPYARDLLEYFDRHVASMELDDYKNIIANDILSAKTSAKSQQRRNLLAQHKNYLFDRRLLFLTYQIKSLGLQDEAGKNFHKAMCYLKKVPFHETILKEDIIKYDATRATNVVFYLKLLDLADWVQEYEKAFFRNFRINSSAKLSHFEFLNLIYGMTHFVIASSDYYQRFLDKDEFSWIFDTFTLYQQRILTELPPDALAEVGLCYKLAKRNNTNFLEKIREKLFKYYRDDQKIMQCKLGRDIDYEKMEHCNAVTLLFLHPIKTLKRGPKIELSHAR